MSQSIGVGTEIRGDTGAPAFSTLNPSLSFASSPPHSPQANSRELDQFVSKSSRGTRRLLRRWLSFSFKHTWVNPLVLVLIVVGVYLARPGVSNPVRPALFLSYPLDHDSHVYGKGLRDLAFVAFYVVFLSFTREFVMQMVLRPLAIRCGIHSRAKQSRFMEQMYTALYFAIFGPAGIYVMSQSPIWYFRSAGYFEGYPHRSLDGLFKMYYLLQAAYWAQQALVLMLQLEKPRKDFLELAGHHVVTLALIVLSYRFHFTHIGLAVYITHDVSDFFLATSKSLGYVDSPLVGPYFVLFIGIWVYLRHYLNLHIIWSMLTAFRTVGPYRFDYAKEEFKSAFSQVIGLGLLACLQAVNLFWLFLILRVAKNYVFSNEVVDERSDVEDEDDDEDDDDDEEAEAPVEPSPREPPATSANGFAGEKSAVGEPPGFRIAAAAAAAHRPFWKTKKEA